MTLKQDITGIVDNIEQYLGKFVWKTEHNALTACINRNRDPFGLQPCLHQMNGLFKHIRYDKAFFLPLGLEKFWKSLMVLDMYWMVSMALFTYSAIRSSSSSESW